MTIQDKEMDLYIKIVSFIRKNGEILRKKHGEWIRFKMKCGTTIIMDTWNGQVSFYLGKCEQSGLDYSGNVVCFHGAGQSLASYYNGKIQYPNLTRLNTVYSLLKYFDWRIKL